MANKEKVETENVEQPRMANVVMTPDKQFIGVGDISQNALFWGTKEQARKLRDELTEVLQ